MSYETIWQFKTANFRVTLECAPDDDCDLSWDDTGEVRANLASGFWTAFVFKVAVYDGHGCELGVDYLGCSIYENASDFRTIGKRDYFPDMVRTAISEARKNYTAPRATLRNVGA